MQGHQAAATATLMDADGKVGRAYGAKDSDGVLRAGIIGVAVVAVVVFFVLRAVFARRDAD